jgi:thiamine pyrophosphate-dependent acetolactate synthase large subunit-like protein
MPPFTHREALEVVAAQRGQRLVLTTMGSISIWKELSDTPFDLFYIPSAMGQGPDLGLGLALAHPERGVIVVNGDGSMLMNLGSLVTLAHHPAPIYLLIVDNGLYEVTGGQRTAGTGNADFAALARGAGISRVHTFASADTWRQGAAEALSGSGPVVVVLRVQGRLGEKTPTPPRPMAEQIARLKQALSAEVVAHPESSKGGGCTP